MRELHPHRSQPGASAGSEADLREEGQPNRQQVLEPVHQQPHGVDGEDRKRAQPQLTGARSARLLQRHRPDGAEVLTPLRGILGTRSVGKSAMKLWRR